MQGLLSERELNMTRMILERRDGKLAGVSESDQRAYERFLGKVRALDGSMVMEYRLPRSGPFHRRHFAIIGALFAAQEQFDDVDNFRKWLEVGAGHAVMCPGPSGRMVAIPDSIKYERLDQSEFEELHAKIVAFVRSTRATHFLWPHLTDQQAAEMVESVLAVFE